MSLTDNPHDPELHQTKPDGQRLKYLILPERFRAFIKDVRDVYIHRTCKEKTRLNIRIAETFAMSPEFYTHTFCAFCRSHFPIQEFEWEDGSQVGT
jgi:hypothetical protein